MLFTSSPVSYLLDIPFVWQKEVASDDSIRINAQRRGFVLVVNYIPGAPLLHVYRGEVNTR
jgi:hypothetical protein